MKNKRWWSEGIRFSCQGSGRCCVARGAYGYVYLTLEDRKNLAKFLKLSTSVFTRKFCDRDSSGYWKLNDFTDSCQFMKGSRCEVYEARPTQCRTWPFWPENMGAKAWSREVASYCPGVGKGKLRTAAEIEKALNAQAESERNY